MLKNDSKVSLNNVLHIMFKWIIIDIVTTTSLLFGAITKVVH